MAFNRKLILQRAAQARDEAAAEKLAVLADGDVPPAEAPKPTASAAAAGRRRTRKDPSFSPRPMDRLELWAPLSVVGIPVTQQDGRVRSFPSGTQCVSLGAPRSAWKGKETLLDIRVEDEEGPIVGWIRAAHARKATEAEAQEAADASGG
jgi:hypothetical protein